MQHNERNKNSLKSCFGAGFSCNKIEQLVAIIQEKVKASDVLGGVKAQRTTVISARSCLSIKCKVKVLMDKLEQIVHFRLEISENIENELSFSETISTVRRGRTQNISVDVMNPTKTDLVLKKGVAIGNICGVSAVFPMKMENFMPKVKAKHMNINGVTNLANGEKWVSKLDLSHLTDEPKGLVNTLLLQECDVFSKDDCDIGDIEDFQMKINLSDQIPVKEAYLHVPRNLYEEVRNDVNDLVINGWVRESFSAYASPIVFFTKRTIHCVCVLIIGN